MRAAFALIIVTLGLNAGGREQVVIDADASPFGDDGAAIVMLLRSPAQVNVDGIVLVAGNTWVNEGAGYLFHILDLMRMPGVSVYAGSDAPLVHTTAMAREAEQRWGKHNYIGAFATEPVKASGHKPRSGGVEYLISEIEHHAGDLTIVAIGPMTNLALALKLRPDLETKIKRVVFMGGNFRVGGNATAMAEFNFWFDPEAARIVLRSKIPQKVMFGLDVTNTAPIRKAQFDEVAGAHTPISDLYREDLGNRYPGFLKNARATAYAWDTLAAAYVIDPEIVVKTETHHLDVQTTWGRFYGSTVPLDRKMAPSATAVTMATQLDLARFYRLYKEKLTAK